jgi:hypothetical protein
MKIFHVSIIFMFFLNRVGCLSILPRKFVDIETNRFFNLVRIFIAISMKVCHYCHENFVYLIGQC